MRLDGQLHYSFDLIGRYLNRILILAFVFGLTKQGLSQCGVAIDLSTWVQEGNVANGNWTVGGGGDNVSQTINGNPTFLVSPDSFINVIISGNIRVNTTDDDDWVGFVFGYQDPDPLNTTNYDFLLFDWKQNFQNFGGFACQEGFSLSRINGAVTNLAQTFAGKAGPFVNVLGTQYGNTEGWNDLTTYPFTLTYTNARTVITIAGDTIFDLYGCFAPGRFGFYNYSQSDVIYSDFSYKVAASFDVVTPEVCVGDTAYLVALNDSCFVNAGVQVNNTIVGWDWNLGDGTLISDTNVAHVYTAPGTYPISLVVTDYLGCKDTAYDEVIVRESNTNIGVDTNFCADTTRLLDAGTPGSTYAWSTGATSQTITIATSGTYQVTLTDIYGCESSDTTIINVYSLPIQNLPADSSICPGDSLILNAGNPGNAFLWSTGELTQTITADSSATYMVTVTNANTCTKIDTFSLNVFNSVTIDPGNDTNICAGDSLVFDAGTIGSAYLWQDGSTNQTITALDSGIYSVTVTLANACITIDSVVLGLYSLPFVNIGPDTSICDLDTITLSASNAITTYLWQDGSTNQTLAINTSGQYQVTVTDANTCSNADTMQLSIFSLPIANLGSDTTICSGDTIVFDPNNPGQNYIWNTGDTLETLTIISIAGDYSVTVTDANTCSKADTVNLGIFATVNIEPGNDTTICDGDSVFFDAGFPGSTYIWSDGTTTQINTALVAGSYEVTVTLPNGCSSSDTVDLDIFTLPSVDLGNDSTICSSDTIVLNASGASLTYLWQDGSTGPTLLAFDSGSFSIIITDTNACSNKDTIIIDLFALPSVDLGIDTAICANDTIQINPNNPGQTYLWNNSSTSENILISLPGSYSVTVTDVNSCSKSDTLILQNHLLPIADIQPDTTICVGDSIILDAENEGAISYLWSNGETNQNIYAQLAGLYSVIITDTNTCTNSDTFQLSLFSLPVINLGADTSICNLDTLMLDAENISATYLWQDGSSLQTFDAAFAGQYEVTVTDTNSCINSDTLILSIYNLPSVNIGPDTSICDLDTITLDAQNVSATYVWQDASTNQMLSVYAAGVYRVTVTDTNTCVNTDSLVLSIFSLPVVDLGPDTIICDFTSYTLNAQNLGATYLWNTGTFAQTFSANSAGTYSVTVTDANTCSNQDEMDLAIQPLPVVSISPSDTSICYGESTTLQASGAQTYVWLNGIPFFTNGLTNALSPANTATFTVVGTDAIGCQSTMSTQIIVMPLPQLSFTLADDTICNEDVVNISVSGAISYAWSPNSAQLNLVGPTNILDPSQTTNFQVTGTDGNGCESTIDTTIVVNPLPTISVTPLGADVCIGATEMLIASGATSYSWFPGTGLNTTINDSVFITPIDTTIYTITGTDDNQCVNDTTIIVNAVPLPVLSLTIASGTGCTAAPSTLNVTGGQTYVWGPVLYMTGEFSDSPIVSPLATTTYYVTATGDAGCQDTASIVAPVFDIPTYSAGSDTTICAGDTFSLNASGGVSYVWNNAPLLSDPNIADPLCFPTVGGFFRVTITDENGCNFKDNMFVTVNPKPVARAGQNISVCKADTVRIGGSPTGPAGTSFSWTPVSQIFDDSSFANPLVFGDTNTTFKVVVTNAFGCSDSSYTTILVDSLPAAEVLSVPEYICSGQPGIVRVTSGFDIYSISPSSISLSRGNGVFEVSPDQSITVRVTVSDLKGCKRELDIPLSVKALPIVSAGEDVVVCEGDTATLYASGNVVSFFWGEQAGLESRDSAITRVFPSNTATYTLAGTDTNGCIGYDDVRAIIHAAPVIDAGEGLQDCDLGIVTLGAYPSGPESGIYSWTPAEGLDNPKAANPTTFIVDSTRFYLEVKNQYGCVAYDSVTVIPDCYNIYAPNSFTPDGDGNNEVFKVYGFRYINPELFIYDRWGNLIFESNDFNIGWDGRDHKGNDVQIGVYFWRLSFTDKLGRGFREEGQVNLIR